MKFAMTGILPNDLHPPFQVETKTKETKIQTAQNMQPANLKRRRGRLWTPASYLKAHGCGFDSFVARTAVLKNPG